MESIVPEKSVIDIKKQKACARSRKKYNLDTVYRENKNKVDNDRNQRRYREDEDFRKRQNAYAKKHRDKKLLQNLNLCNDFSQISSENI